MRKGEEEGHARIFVVRIYSACHYSGLEEGEREEVVEWTRMCGMKYPLLPYSIMYFKYDKLAKVVINRE